MKDGDVDSMDRPYPEGVDCVWLGADRSGYVAAFVTGGIGPIPVSALDSERIRVEEIEERVCELPRVSKAKQLVVTKRPDAFVDLAERGFFVYDWSDVHRRKNNSVHAYEPVAVPVTPATLGILPDEIASLVRGVALDVAFADGKMLDVLAYADCRDGSQRRGIIPTSPVGERMTRLACRVCGLLQESPPWGADNRMPLFEHCPCCAVEWGYQDATPMGARRFRERWLKEGAPWDRPDLRPADWDVDQQLAAIPAEFK